MKIKHLDKIGAVGAIVAAGGCPACFPALAALGSVLGLGFLQQFEEKALIVFQILVIIALIGNVISYLNHKKVIPLIIGVLGALVIFFAWYIHFSYALFYIGLIALFVAAISNIIAKKKCPKCQEG